MLFVSQLQCIIVRATDVHCYKAGDWCFCKTFQRLEYSRYLLHTHTHTKTIKSVGKIIKPAKMNRWAKQVSSLLILLINVRMLQRLILCIFRPRNYLIGILRKGCFVIPLCVVSVIPATVMYKRQKLVKHIYSLQKTQAGVSSIQVHFTGKRDSPPALS